MYIFQTANYIYLLFYLSFFYFAFFESNFFVFYVQPHFCFVQPKWWLVSRTHMSCQKEKTFAALQNDHNINNNNNNSHNNIIMTLLSPRFATYRTSSTTRADTAVEPSFHTGDLKKIIIEKLHKDLESFQIISGKNKLYNPYVRNLTKNYHLTWKNLWLTQDFFSCVSVSYTHLTLPTICSV